ncbi:DsbC family protein [Pseudomonadota bacterium]
MRLIKNPMKKLAVPCVAPLLLSALLIQPVIAETKPDKAKIANATKNLTMMVPGLENAAVTPAPVPGLYEVIVGPDVLYVTQDGRYLIQGSIIDLEARENLTAPRVAQAAATAIEKVGEENMVIYEPKETKHTISIFTDIDCGYCRKLHGQMDEYLAHGIRVRYLFFPRAGVQSESARKATAVWCADDRNAAMTLAKSGQKIEMKDCKNPVSNHYSLGEQMGIRGTPALVLEDGEKLPGYVPPDRLNDYLTKKAEQAASK